jgi:hypothetical protein
MCRRVLLALLSRRGLSASRPSPARPSTCRRPRWCPPTRRTGPRTCSTARSTPSSRSATRWSPGACSPGWPTRPRRPRRSPGATSSPSTPPPGWSTPRSRQTVKAVAAPPWPPSTGHRGAVGRHHPRRLQARRHRQLDLGGRPAARPDRDARPGRQPGHRHRLGHQPLPAAVRGDVRRLHARHRRLARRQLPGGRDHRRLPCRQPARRRRPLGDRRHRPRPLSWNPGRDRGVGVFALVATARASGSAATPNASAATSTTAASPSCPWPAAPRCPSPGSAPCQATCSAWAWTAPWPAAPSPAPPPAPRPRWPPASHRPGHRRQRPGRRRPLLAVPRPVRPQPGQLTGPWVRYPALHHAPVAQGTEQLSPKQQAAGSSPARGTGHVSSQLRQARRPSLRRVITLLLGVAQRSMTRIIPVGRASSAGASITLHASSSRNSDGENSKPLVLWR